MGTIGRLLDQWIFWSRPPHINGTIDNGLAFNVRVSQINSDGYRDNSGHYGKSAYFSVGYYQDDCALKYVTFYGDQENEMAYLATAQLDLDVNRKMNYLSPDERDHFKYWYNSLQYVSKHLTNTTYFIKLNGTYGIMFDEMYDFHLSSYFVGNVTSVNYNIGENKLYAGLHFNTYKRSIISKNSIFNFNY